MSRFIVFYFSLLLPLSIAASLATADVPFTYKANTIPTPSTNLTLRPQEAPVIPERIVEGSVLSIDDLFGKLEMTASNGETIQFWVGTNTPIRNAQGLQLSLNDIHSGDPVTVQYQTGTLTVNWIEKH